MLTVKPVLEHITMQESISAHSQECPSYVGTVVEVKFDIMKLSESSVETLGESHVSELGVGKCGAHHFSVAPP